MIESTLHWMDTRFTSQMIFFGGGGGREIDYVIVASLAFHEIRDQLFSYGIKKEQIIRAEVFSIPWFDWEKYLVIKSQNYSIISNYCLGGRIYKELGLEQLAPTVNAYCSGLQYIKFLKNIKKYLSSDMVCHIDEDHRDGTVGQETFCPKGILENEIVWNFNHCTTAQEGVVLWNKRRTRVNWDKLVILMILQSDEEAFEFSRLPYSHKLGFYHKELNLQDIVYCRRWEEADIRKLNHYSFPVYVNNYMLNDNYQLGKIDWISFLYGDKHFIRYT